MLEEDKNILKYNLGEKSVKVPFVIYADTEPLLEKIDTFYNNPEKSSTTKVNECTACGYSLEIEMIRFKDGTKNFCKDLKEHAMKISNFERLKMLPLTEKDKSYYKQKLYYICKNRFNK